MSVSYPPTPSTPAIAMHEKDHSMHTHQFVQSFADAKRSNADLVITVHANGSATESPASHSLESYDATCKVQNSSKLWLKVDLAILPVVTMIFFLSFLDKSNIGNARVAGLQKELAMSDYQYTLALTVNYIPYILVELPSNLWLKRIGPNILLPSMAVLWGIATTFQGFVTSYQNLVVCRFFIGLFEGGLLPGLMLYLSGFYPKRMLQLRISAFFVSTSLAGASSGFFASFIAHMDGVGGKPGWAWIFILEGVFTMLFGILSFFLLPRTPLHIPSLFLTPTEKTRIVEVLSADGVLCTTLRSDVHNKDSEAGFSRRQRAVETIHWPDVWRTFTEPRVWLLVLAGFFNGSMLSGLAYFLPSIVATLGYTEERAQLMSVPPFAVSFVASMVLSYISDRYNKRNLTIVICSVLTTIGWSIFLGTPNPHARYASLFLLVPGTYSAAPPLATILSNLSVSYTARATSIALLVVFTNLGGVLSMWLLGELSHGPDYTSAAWTFLAFGVGCGVLAVLNGAWYGSQARTASGGRRSSWL